MADSSGNDASFRNLPSVNELASFGGLAWFPITVRIAAARSAISAARLTLSKGEPMPNLDGLAVRFARQQTDISLQPVINGTGVVLHTGLGRARLADSVAAHIQSVAAGYSALELDLESGERGDRQSHVRDILLFILGGEDALVVNNAAGALYLALAALTPGREVVLSRGQMVEIGGSFRLPEIVSTSGARLVEVGCTNKTHLEDYLRVLGPETAAILRCHPSNFRIVGFTSEPSLADLSHLAREKGCLLIDDHGAGGLLDLRTVGLTDSSSFVSSVAHSDLAIASGDKLFGAPQAGIMVGKRGFIDQIRRHPLARGLRIDKLCLAGLESTLRLWANGEEDQIPTIRYLRKSLGAVREEAERIASAWPFGVVEEGITEAGSGSAPGTGIPTYRAGFAAASLEELARTLRSGSPPIIGRIEKDRFWLDPRTMEQDEVEVVIRRVKELAP